MLRYACQDPDIYDSISMTVSELRRQVFEQDFEMNLKSS